MGDHLELRVCHSAHGGFWENKKRRPDGGRVFETPQWVLLHRELREYRSPATEFGKLIPSPQNPISGERLFMLLSCLVGKKVLSL